MSLEFLHLLPLVVLLEPRNPTGGASETLGGASETKGCIHVFKKQECYHEPTPKPRNHEIRGQRCVGATVVLYQMLFA